MWNIAYLKRLQSSGQVTLGSSLSCSSIPSVLRILAAVEPKLDQHPDILKSPISGVFSVGEEKTNLKTSLQESWEK